MMVAMDDKRFFLERYIQDHPESKIMVFVRTKVRAERVVKAMERVGIETVAIHGDKDQKDRSLGMSAFRHGQCRILVATDVSARGIDIPDVNAVINYDLPTDPENYVHRVGRTGRGTRKGVALSFCSPEETGSLEAIETFLEKPVDRIEVSKTDYSETIAYQGKGDDVMALIGAHEDLMAKRKKRKKT